MTVYLGIDWSQHKHDVCVLDAGGRRLAQWVMPHTPEGFATLDTQRRRLNVTAGECRVAIETAHNLLIDWLWGHGYTHVFIVPPGATGGYRSRYGQSGAQSDPGDAFVLADVLRTDGQRLPPWSPDSGLVRQLRAQVSVGLHLTQEIVRLSNRLRAVLWRYYPAALHVFSSLSTQIALEFVCAYPTPQAAAALTFDEFQAFARQHRYTHLRQLPKRFARLQQPMLVAEADTVAAFQPQAVLLASLLLPVVRAKARLRRELDDLFQQHPDAPIFMSLPGVGELLAPALLAKFGDDRRRFPTVMSVQALAGTCPVTDQSGRRRRVYFRRACDHEFRTIMQQWAKASLDKSVWAQAYWQQVRPRCRSDSDAYRRLANRWLAILWTLWQTHQTYDEAYHLQRRAQRRRA